MARGRLVLIVAALSLGGCNLVTSKTPLFTRADTVETPVFRAGLWASDDPTCRFDADKPKDEWPECAGGKVIPAGQGVLQDEDGGEILIAAGDPLIAQYRPPKGDGPQRFVYGALRPTKTDAQGRVIGVEAWLIACGPPPPETKRSNLQNPPKPRDFVTKHPLPGLKVDDANCLATAAKVVRNAATANLAWQKPQATRWIRDSGP